MIDETAPVLHRAAHIGSRSGAGPQAYAATGEAYR